MCARQSRLGAAELDDEGHDSSPLLPVCPATGMPLHEPLFVYPDIRTQRKIAQFYQSQKADGSPAQAAVLTVSESDRSAQREREREREKQKKTTNGIV